MNQDLPDPYVPSVDAEGGGACAGGGACGCGARADDAPVLDVRVIPHAVRHAAVLGAIGGVPVAGDLVLIAPHDPLPLLRELQAREPDSFRVGYDESGPETWAVRLTRLR